MSLQIIKAGIFDTIQDSGRPGYRHIGIGISGAADRYAAQLANCLLGKDFKEPVIEMHFPAASIRLTAATIICITGADFSPEVNGNACPLNQPIAVAADSVLNFSKPVKGARCYLAVLHSFKLEPWLGSYSTSLVSKTGGINGKKLEKGMKIEFTGRYQFNSILKEREMKFLPWRVEDPDNEKLSVRILQGVSWSDLKYDSQKILLNDTFHVSNMSDRMGIQLQGTTLEMQEKSNFLSTAVAFGTVQLLPNGQLIILMADHQTTGGYPQVAHVIGADCPVLAQKPPNSLIRFTFTNQHTADMLLLQQQRYLRELRSSCDIQMQHLLHA